MIYLKNYGILMSIKIANKLGRGHYLKKKIFSSRHILECNYPEKSAFNFVQVGANDGVSFDFLYGFVTKRNSQGVVIEPIKKYFSELVKNYQNYPKIIKVNKAVHPTQKKVLINRISTKAIDKYPSWAKGIASIDTNHHKKVNVDSNDMVKEEANADTLMNIITQNMSNSQLDYIQIDTEGFDYEVIKMIDFKKIKPDILKYENVHLDTKQRIDVEVLLKKQGYSVFKENGDSIAINLNKIKLF